MNWDAIGAVGEILGAAAVVLSLVYLATQIRQGTSATRTATRDAAMAQTLSFFEQGLDTTVIARAAHKRAVGEQIDDFENGQLVRYQLYNFKIFENVHFHYREGVLSDSEWDYYRRIMRSVLNTNEASVEMFNNTRGHDLWREAFLREIDLLVRH